MDIETAAFQAQAEKIRSSGILGQARLLQLFNYLVICTAAGRVPKEAEVAVEVFGREPTADLSQDASVRVYIHNLRRKLEQHYADAGRSERQILVLPKGEYRLLLLSRADIEPVSSEALEAPRVAQFPPASVAPSNRPRWWLATIALALLVVTAGSIWVAARVRADPLDTVRQTPIWSSILHSTRPLLLVVGDYYIFGDNEGGMDVTRLVREFSVNSKADLEQFLLSRPKDASRYQDVGLSYLPTSTAYALATLMPVLAPAGRRLRIILASELAPRLLKNDDVIYIGLLSGLGVLQTPALSTSRFHFGDSFDELIDGKTGARYVSQALDYDDDPATATSSGKSSYRDYGYFSQLTGPSGNRIVIVGGMQDEGLRQTADFLADAATLKTLYGQVPGQADLEALLQVSGLDHVNLSGKLLLAAPLARPAWQLDTPNGAATAPQPVTDGKPH